MPTDKNSCLSYSFDYLQKPFSTETKRQLTAMIVGVLLGMGADYLVETNAKLDNWLYDALITSSVTMTTAVLTNVAIWGIRRLTCCSNEAKDKPLGHELPRLLVWELLSFVAGVGVGIGVEALREALPKNLITSVDLTAAIVSPVRTALRNIGFYGCKSINVLRRSEQSDTELLVNSPKTSYLSF
jgi:DMSO reductase anchor subunit